MADSIGLLPQEAEPDKTVTPVCHSADTRERPSEPLWVARLGGNTSADCRARIARRPVGLFEHVLQQSKKLVPVDRFAEQATFFELIGEIERGTRRVAGDKEGRNGLLVTSRIIRIVSMPLGPELR